MLVPLSDTKVKLFDPKDGFGAITSIRVFTDASVFKRGNRWWMIGGRFDLRKGNIVLLSAALPVGAPLSAKGWSITTAPDDPAVALALVPLFAERELGRRGWDRPDAGVRVLR